jgi:hypothetical protein
MDAPNRRTIAGCARGVGVSLLLFAAPATAKDTFSTCQSICDTLTSTACTITTTHDVVAGSAIDCTSARTITIDGGHLRVHDGTFSLSGKSLTLTNGGTIIADCPQGFTPVGYTLRTTESVGMVASSQTKLAANCTTQGGRIAIDAGTTIVIQALGIDVDGGGASAPGGSVRLDAAGAITIWSDVHADAKSQGAAAGGTISVRGDSVTVYAELRAKGYGASTVEMPGGDITLEADGDVVVSSGGGLNVGSAKGAGGDISIVAGGLANIGKPLKAWGTGGSVGVGGNVYVSGDEVRVNSDITVTGGKQGGYIELAAEDGGVLVGTSANATLDANGNGSESGGAIEITASGGDVTLGSGATVQVTGASGAAGGSIQIQGDDIATDSAAKVYADGASPDLGGQIEVTALGTMTLAGTVQANNQGSKTFIYKTTTPSIAGSISGYELVQMSDL